MVSENAASMSIMRWMVAAIGAWLALTSLGLGASAQDASVQSGAVALPGVRAPSSVMGRAAATPVVQCYYGSSCSIQSPSTQQTVDWQLQAFCYANGQPANSTETLSFSVAPSKFKVTASPNPVIVTPQQDPSPWTMTAQIPQNLAVGSYVITPTGVDNTNGPCKGNLPFTPPTTTLNVVPPTPVITGSSGNINKNTGLYEVWWFNGEKPTNYPTSITLTASPNQSGAKYNWTIDSGTAFAEFSNKKTTMTTSTNTVDLALNAAPKGTSGNVLVVATMTVGKTVSSPSPHFPITARGPTSIVPAKPIDVDVTKNLIFTGFETVLPYMIVDQNAQVLDRGNLDAREVFTTNINSPIKDFPGTNWLVGKINGDPGKPVDPTFFNDDITHNTSNGDFPVPTGPQECLNMTCPEWGQKVIHWCGYVQAGSRTAGKGVKLATITWQLFQNHGRHCDFASPPAAKTPPCPGANAAVCPTN
jgi:hypothetical protein